ncbi:MAG TPA: glycosyltransferase N-terminal domain-containing protein [Gemmatimonadaceae bacterium]|nr:glycosyltransferase N-terminal domain-containing protein [Gemmatimonadaceae bacterium]
MTHGTRSLLHLSYRAAGELARLGAALAPSGGGKTARALRARRGIRARYAAWGRAGRDARRPLLWMHAPSVGEGLQARPVIELLRTSHPELQIAYTHFSPSAERFARSLGVDFADYLPFDTPGDARAALDALRPRAIVFSKLDVWPVLAREAAARGVRLGLTSATLAEESSRRGGIAASLLHDAYASLDAVGAIDPEDAGRLVALGVRGDIIAVTGDTRYDQVWERAMRVDRSGELLAPLASERPTLVAGSTWPADEAVLLPAWLELRRALPTARMVIAPHEPTSAHLEPIERWAAGSAIALARLGTPAARSADVVLVDRVGVLGDLYALADAAYVGGGFGSAGLHSVLEPAAFGAPVAFGPRFISSRDARLLDESGGGAHASDAAMLAGMLSEWLGDRSARERAGGKARDIVRSGLGAAERSSALVQRLLFD